MRPKQARGYCVVSTNPTFCSSFDSGYSDTTKRCKYMNMTSRRPFLVFAPLLLLFLVLATTVQGQSADPQTEILIVTAHPDDEALFAGSVFKMTHDHDIAVDLAVITDGAGGYKYSVLAESIYGLELTDPEVARQYLPGIRKQELMAGGSYIGLRNYYFFDQPDTGYTLDADSILSDVWDSAAVENWLTSTLDRQGYDFVLVHLPREETHGHHKGASILAIRAAANAQQRPVVLGGWFSLADDPKAQFAGLERYPITAVTTEGPQFHFNRLTPFGHNDRLNYQIVANWLIAEHKTQGTMQMLMGVGEIEDYWLFTENPADAHERAAQLFEMINSAQE